MQGRKDIMEGGKNKFQGRVRVRVREGDEAKEGAYGLRSLLKAGGGAWLPLLFRRSGFLGFWLALFACCRPHDFACLVPSASS
jgi:hypothetical protein